MATNNTYAYNPNMSFGDSAVDRMLAGNAYLNTVGNIPAYTNTADFLKSAGTVATTANDVVDTSKAFDIQDFLGMKDGGLFGMSSDQMGMAGGLAGLAMKGFAMPSMMDAYKQQTKNLKQQYDFNKQSMADTKQFQNTWADASNSLAGAKKQTAVG